MEMRLLDTLAAAGLPDALRARALETRTDDTSAGLEATRLDLGSLEAETGGVAHPVLFLNDLESDPQYQRFGRALSELLNVYPGR